VRTDLRERGSEAVDERIATAKAHDVRLAFVKDGPE